MRLGMMTTRALPLLFLVAACSEPVRIRKDPQAKPLPEVAHPYEMELLCDTQYGCMQEQTVADFREFGRTAVCRQQEIDSPTRPLYAPPLIYPDEFQIMVFGPVIALPYACVWNF